ncbi:energy transducer TonB [Marivirga arenosa]|uniref:Energy transducer TonB n=1 Tax=Marivirga arenosa TaxID=3059076 RepID=A0AA49J9T3_9BACT|nr:energy transducer TonB [Marivirga sp. BKB1-2]WKK82881.2 energy transducer TonB [Marivirga sp. BKB1-2]
MRGGYKNIDHLKELSNQEISKHKDFKALLNRRTEQLQHKNNVRKSMIRIVSSLAVVSIIGSSLFYWNYVKNNEEISTEKDQIALKNNIDFMQKSLPKLPKAKQSHKEKISRSNNPIKSNSKKETGIVKQNMPKDEEEKIQLGYKRAIPIVGIDSLNQYFNERIIYPESVDKSEGIEGTVNVIFEISKTGEANIIQIQNSLGSPFDEECERLISNMPKWEPAIRNGKPVNSRVSIQLSFEFEPQKD